MSIISLITWLASRPRKKSITTIVLHATAGSSLSGALSTLRLKGFSYHYIIEKNGRATKCVPYSRVAFHAGKSSGPTGPNVNEGSIGICFVNRNDGADPYPEAQIEACKSLVGELINAIPLRWITTHFAISPGRKTDPKGFPVERVAMGLERWKC